ncbi:MAG TPA: hypothetical protein DDW73_18780 [Rhizobium sp.]|nr:hypothetical protein [Rhizobium sp.]
MLFSGERHFASTTFFSDLTAFSALLCHGFNFTSALAGPAKTAAIKALIIKNRMFIAPFLTALVYQLHLAFGNRFWQVPHDGR